MKVLTILKKYMMNSGKVHDELWKSTTYEMMKSTWWTLEKYMMNSGKAYDELWKSTWWTLEKYMMNSGKVQLLKWWKVHYIIWIRNICLMYNYCVYNNLFWIFHIQMEYPSAQHAESYGRANRVSYISLLFLTPSD